MLHGDKKADSSKKKVAISYWAKEQTVCPICQKKFDKEEMFSGGGRLNAGDLTDELHRIFVPTARFGTVYPLIYQIGACPFCHSAFFWSDFASITDENEKSAILADSEKRQKMVETVFPHYNLKRQRSLFDGIAMYYLALLCYEKLDIKHSPTVKKAIISLRLAWLCNELNTVIPNYNYDYVSKVFYQKAMFFYQQTLIKETSGVEPIAGLANFGPDIDKNYGYDGIIYLCGLLEYKYGSKDDMALRGKKLDEYKRSIARIFGLGKSSKAKPGPLLENARTLYTNMAAELSANNLFDDIDDDDSSDENAASTEN